jgi:hypothetical protein
MFRLVFLCIAIVTACCVALGSPAPGKKKDRAAEQAADASGVPLPDFQVQTSSGPVSFHDVVLSSESRKDQCPRISGIVSNLTDRKWTAVLFQLELLDSAGKTVGRAPLLYRNLERGQSRQLTNEPVQLLDPSQKDFSGYRVEYRTGEIELTYVLTMMAPERNRLLQYADEDAEFSFSVTDSCIELKLKNRSSSAASVDWRGAEFVDIFAKSHEVRRVGGGDGKMIPFGVLAATVEPVFDRPVIEDEYAGWRSGRVLPRTDDAGPLKGKIVSLVLPVETGGVRKTYRFVFQVAEILYQ